MINRRLLPLLLLPALGIAADQPSESPSAPAPAAASPAAAAAQWGGEHGFAILAKDDRGVRVGTDIGPVVVGSDLADDPVAAPTLSDLVARGRAAGVSEPELTFGRSPLTGLRLSSARVLVTGEGVLTRLPLSPADRQADVTRVRDEAAKAKLPERLSPIARKALGSLLDHLDDAEDPDLDLTGIDPAVARRLAQAGFLRQWLGDAAEPIERAAAAPATGSATVSWKGEGLALDELVDAFGHHCWTLRTAQHAVLVAPATLPVSYPRARFEKALLRLELPPNADPIAPTDAEIAGAKASLSMGGAELARWSRAEGLVCDETAWRAQLSDHPRGYEHAVAHYLPPHIAIRDGAGAVRLLVTAHGAVRPPDGSSADGERFLDEAAKALPDAAHLALVGHYCFNYCYDSPDPREPLLLGTLDEHGDIHQTAAQTLATAVGGRVRGDCDDLAELFEALCKRQGRNPIVISLPRHLACAYAERQGEAEKQGDGDSSRWHVFVLHTGHPMEFVDAKLPQALVAMYRSFDERATIDPAQIPLSLRFAGENTRTHWVLSWRVFSEPEYARTMFEVERDWYFRTYQRGITRMQAMIAAGDRDPANFDELRGLYDFTGQWDEAIAYARRALEGVDNDVIRLERSIQLVGLLTNGERHQEAAELARRISEEDLPALAPKLKLGLPRLANRLARSFDARRDPDLCLDILERWSVPNALATVAPLHEWIRDHFDQRAWDDDPRIEELRGNASAALSAAQTALEKSGLTAAGDPGPVADCLRLQRAYLDDMAFRSREPGSLPYAYAFAGWCYELALGRPTLRAMLAEAPLPTADVDDHADRSDGIAQVRRDLPWIRASVPYWWSAVAREAWGENGKGPCNVKAALADLDELQRAFAASQALGQVSRFQVSEAAQARVLAGLLAQDERALGEALDAVAADHDRALTESAATLIGQASAFLPLPWFDRALAAWKDHVDNKPFYLAIAWTAYVRGSPQHALAAARFAATRFADDPAFAEEQALIEQLVAAKARTKTP